MLGDSPRQKNTHFNHDALGKGEFSSKVRQTLLLVFTTDPNVVAASYISGKLL